MRPPPPPSPQPTNGDDQPAWTKMLLATAASMQPPQQPPQQPSASVPIAAQPAVSYQQTGTKTPLEEYGGQIQLGLPADTKRFKRAVDPVPPPPQPPRQPEYSSSGLFGLDTPGQHGALRPFSKGDADTLHQAKQMLDASLTGKTPTRSPMDVASLLMQKCIPHFVNVDWGTQTSFRDDYNRLLVTCQRILTGQELGDGQEK